MFLFYIDESGNEDNPADRYFVLGGAAVFERVTFFLSQAIDQVQAKHFPGAPPIPFHASHIRSGKDFWRSVAEEKRKEVLSDLVNAIAAANKPGVVLFAAAVEKTNLLYGDDAVEHATAEAQRGLLIFSEGRFHKRTSPSLKITQAARR